MKISASRTRILLQKLSRAGAKDLLTKNQIAYIMERQLIKRLCDAGQNFDIKEINFLENLPQK